MGAVFGVGIGVVGATAVMGAGLFLHRFRIFSAFFRRLALRVSLLHQLLDLDLLLDLLILRWRWRCSTEFLW